MFIARENIFSTKNIDNLQIFDELIQTGTCVSHNAHNYTVSIRINLNIIYGSITK